MPAGRPIIVTDEIKDAIVESIAMGMSRIGAAELQGLSWEAVRLHCKIDHDFFVRIKKADAAFESWCIAEMANGKSNTWQRIAWLLERKFPARYSADALMRQFAIEYEAEQEEKIVTAANAKVPIDQ